MAVIPVNETEENLLCAFVCETLASRRLQAFAATSEARGERHAASVLRHLARRRGGHAEEHLRMLDGFETDLTDRLAGDVRSDLRAAIAGERERSASYAGMARTAREEGFDEIADWFETLAKAGRSHVGRFQRALDTLTERSSWGFGT
jgi:rubrerythrin